LERDKCTTENGYLDSMASIFIPGFKPAFKKAQFKTITAKDEDLNTESHLKTRLDT